MEHQGRNKTKLILTIAVGIIFLLQLCVPFLIIAVNATDKEAEYLAMGYTKVEFRDLNMVKGVMFNLEDKEIIRDGLDLYIKPEDIESTTIFDLSDYKIEDITGIEVFTALTEVNLSNNKIQDITKLASLNNLTKINLSGNKVQDISCLSNEYEELDLTNQTIEVTLGYKLYEDTLYELPQIFKDERVKVESEYHTYKGYLRYMEGQTPIYNYSITNGLKEDNLILYTNAYGTNREKLEVEGGIANGSAIYVTYVAANMRIVVEKSPEKLTNDVITRIKVEARNEDIAEAKVLDGIKAKEDFVDNENAINILEEDNKRQCLYLYESKSIKEIDEETSEETYRISNKEKTVYIKDTNNEEYVRVIDIDNIVAYIEVNEEGTKGTLDFIDETGHRIANSENEEENRYIVTNENGIELNSEGSYEHTFTEDTHFIFKFIDQTTEEEGIAEAGTKNIRIEFNDERLYNGVKANLGEIDYIDVGYSQILEKYIILMPQENIDRVTQMNLKNRGIEDLTGLEVFTKITNLDISLNSITEEGLYNTLNILNNLKEINLACYSSHDDNYSIIDGTKFSHENLEKLNVSYTSPIINISSQNGTQIIGWEYDNGNFTNEPIFTVNNCKIKGDIKIRRTITNCTVQEGNIINCYGTVSNCIVEDGDILVEDDECYGISWRYYDIDYKTVVEYSTANTIQSTKVTYSAANIIEGILVENNTVKEKIIPKRFGAFNNFYSSDRQYFGTNVNNNKSYIGESYEIVMNFSNADYGSSYKFYISNDQASKITINNTSGKQRIYIDNMNKLEDLEINSTDGIGIIVTNAPNLKYINKDIEEEQIVGLLKLVNVANNVEEGLNLDLTKLGIYYIGNEQSIAQYDDYVIKRIGYIENSNITKLSTFGTKDITDYIYDSFSYHLQLQLEQYINSRPEFFGQTSDTYRLNASKYYTTLIGFDREEYGYDYCCDYLDFIRGLENLQSLIIKGETPELNLNMKLKSKLQTGERK